MAGTENSQPLEPRAPWGRISPSAGRRAKHVVWFVRRSEDLGDVGRHVCGPAMCHAPSGHFTQTMLLTGKWHLISV